MMGSPKRSQAQAMAWQPTVAHAQDIRSGRAAATCLTIPGRFISKVVKTDSCWLWVGTINHRHGYGSFGIGGVNRGAHRVSWELHRGQIPAGLQLDHLCRVKRCVNPDHLEPVTPRENTARGWGKNARALRENRCHWGHDLIVPNVYVDPSGGRRCRRCDSERHQRARRRGAA